MASEFELTLTDFDFPAALPDRRANFRFVVDVRMVRSAKFATDTMVMPGFDSWWECDRKKSKQPNYVRRSDSPSFDMTRLDAWERLVLLTRADLLHSIQVKIFDVDRPDAWDTLRGAFSRIAETALRRAPRVLDLPELAEDGFGAIEEDLRSTVAMRLAGGDRLLFRGSAPLVDPGEIRIEGPGAAGTYSVGLRFEKR
jgi:hypothetical protein